MAKKIVFEPFVYPIDPVTFKVCGADEAGRGPLMGNVVAACVILDPNNPIAGLNQHKIYLLFLLSKYIPHFHILYTIYQNLQIFSHQIYLIYQILSNLHL